MITEMSFNHQRDIPFKVFFHKADTDFTKLENYNSIDI